MDAHSVFIFPHASMCVCFVMLHDLPFDLKATNNVYIIKSLYNDSLFSHACIHWGDFSELLCKLLLCSKHYILSCEV